MIQPLHIFEERYRQMVADALAGDELIATALMKPGWEPHYEGRPAIHSTVCIGRIMTHTRLDDGRYNLLLQGVCRGRIIREIPTDRMYRMADVQTEEISSVPSSASLELRGQKMRDQFIQLCQRDATMDFESIQCLLRENVALDLLTDLIAFSLNAPPTVKQAILDSSDLASRLDLVSGQLERQLHEPSAAQLAPGFPPCFSSN